MKKIKKLLSWHWHLIRSGLWGDFLVLVRSDANNAVSQGKILKSANNIVSRTKSSQATYLMALEAIADVHMRQHKFEQAAEDFRDAIMANRDNGISYQKLGYLYESLAACYFNLNDRDKTIDVIHEAIANGLNIASFKGLIDDNKLRGRGVGVSP